MFARHDIVALGQRSRDVPHKCGERGGRWGDRGGTRGQGTRGDTAPTLILTLTTLPSAARGALHHVLHRQEVAAVHPLLPGHAGVGEGLGGRGGG